MLARSTRLDHPAGLEIETPLLIPSFSSKGFGVSRDESESELETVFRAATEFLADSMLVSAYDLHHGLLPRPSHPITDITVLDSGGYETSDHVDLSATFVQKVSTLEWNKEMHIAELKEWSPHVPAVFVTYDDGATRLSLTEQIKEASDYLAFADKQLIAFLIRPETDRQKYVQVENIIAAASHLSAFHVIGLTEKELGGSALDRMVAISRIRAALDGAGVSSPIHVFGCLDPISVPLYFLAGAEVFDGLSWFRYGYSRDVAMYRHNSAALDIGIHRTDDFVKMKTLQDNLSQLVDLRHHLRRFLVNKDFKNLGRHADLFRDSLESLSAKTVRPRSA